MTVAGGDRRTPFLRAAQPKRCEGALERRATCTTAQGSSGRRAGRSPLRRLGLTLRYAIKANPSGHPRPLP